MIIGRITVTWHYWFSQGFTALTISPQLSMIRQKTICLIRRSKSHNTKITSNVAIDVSLYCIYCLFRKTQIWEKNAQSQYSQIAIFYSECYIAKCCNKLTVHIKVLKTWGNIRTSIWSQETKHTQDIGSLNVMRFQYFNCFSWYFCFVDLVGDWKNWSKKKLG